MQPSLDRAMQAEESKRQETAKAIIEAAEAPRDLILAETYVAIDNLIALQPEHCDMERAVREKSKDPSQGRGRWTGFGYGPPSPIIAQLAGWAEFVRKSK